MATPRYYFPVHGWRGNYGHWGNFVGNRGAADLIAREGTPLYAITDGRVKWAGWSKLGGWGMTLVGDDGQEYYYGHMPQAAAVRAGQRVQAGQRVGAVGNTGHSSTAHLHLGIGRRTSDSSTPWLRGGYGIDFDAQSWLRRVFPQGWASAPVAGALGDFSLGGTGSAGGQPQGFGRLNFAGRVADLFGGDSTPNSAPWAAALGGLSSNQAPTRNPYLSWLQGLQNG